MFTALPAFDAVCSESGISFTLVHRPFHSFWEIWIGSELLTPQLAVRRGYVMSNDSQTLVLEVPLFSHGYEYEVRTDLLAATTCVVQLHTKRNDWAACVL